MKKILASVFVITLLGSGVYASGCSEMAAFNTKIKKALKTASFNEKTLADIKSLQSECKRQHDMGWAGFGLIFGPAAHFSWNPKYQLFQWFGQHSVHNLSLIHISEPTRH